MPTRRIGMPVMEEVLRLRHKCRRAQREIGRACGLRAGSGLCSREHNPEPSCNGFQVRQHDLVDSADLRVAQQRVDIEPVPHPVEFQRL